MCIENKMQPKKPCYTLNPGVGDKNADVKDTKPVSICYTT